MINSNVNVPHECNNSDENRVMHDANGFLINLSRCKLITEEQIKNGETDYCDEIRAFGKCPKGFK